MKKASANRAQVHDESIRKSEFKSMTKASANPSPSFCESIRKSEFKSMTKASTSLNFVACPSDFDELRPESCPPNVVLASDEVLSEIIR